MAHETVQARTSGWTVQQLHGPEPLSKIDDICNSVDITNDLSQRAALAALGNARAFLRDAATLVKTGSHGHAISLLVLSEEEFGKAVLWICHMLGFVPPPVHMTHRAKQFTGMAMSFVLEYVFAPILHDLRKIPPRLAKAEKMRRVTAVAEKYIGKWSKTPNESLVPFVSKAVERFLALEDKKQAGFYVDISAGNVVSSPLALTETEARKYLKTVKRRDMRLAQMFLVDSQGIELRDVKEALQGPLSQVRDTIPKLTEALQLASRVRSKRT